MSSAGTKLTKHVKLSPQTHKRLGELGGKGESFNKIISRVIDHYLETGGKKRGAPGKR